MPTPGGGGVCGFPSGLLLSQPSAVCALKGESQVREVPFQSYKPDIQRGRVTCPRSPEKRPRRIGAQGFESQARAWPPHPRTLEQESAWQHEQPGSGLPLSRPFPRHTSTPRHAPRHLLVSMSLSPGTGPPQAALLWLPMAALPTSSFTMGH